MSEPTHYVFKRETIEALAEAIRAKSGESSLLSVEQMTSLINGLHQGGEPTQFTNVLELDTTTFIEGKYWSPNSATWTAKDACRTVIFEVPSGILQIRLRGALGFAAATSVGGSQVLLSNSTEDGFVVVDRWFNLCSMDEYHDPIITVDNSAGYKYCALPLGAGAYTVKLYAAQIVTVNELIGNNGYTVEN